MPRCLYCTASDPAEFTTVGEHVMPQLFGKFIPDLTLGDDLVCTVCNNGFLSRIDDEFGSDSPEGHFAHKILVAPNTFSVREKRRRFRLKTTLSGCSGAFSEAFLMWDPAIKRWCLPAIVIMHKKDGAPVHIMPRTLIKIASRPKSKEFDRKKRFLDQLNQKGMFIVGDDQFSVEETVGALKRFGITHTEATRNTIQPGQEIMFNSEFEMEWDQDLLRLPAKIAFHYFAYCAKESGYREVLFSDHFIRVREFIKGNIKTLPVTVQRGGVVKSPGGPQTQSRLGPEPVHGVLFYENKGFVVARVSLFNLFTYEMALGTYPLSDLCPRGRFGSGHAFLLEDGTVVPIFSTRTPIVRSKDFSLLGQ